MTPSSAVRDNAKIGKQAIKARLEMKRTVTLDPIRLAHGPGSGPKIKDKFFSSAVGGSRTLKNIK